MAAEGETNGTPSGLKRTEPPTDEDGPPAAPASAPAKKRKTNGTGKKARSTFDAISAAISNVFGAGASPQQPLQSPGVAGGTPSAAPSPIRPAIKLKALKGTIWDTQEEKPRLSASASASNNTTPKSAKSKGKGTPGASPLKQGGTSNANTPTKPRSVGRPKGSKNIKRASNEDAPLEQELVEAGLDATTPTGVKQATVKRLWGSSAASPAPKSILTPTKNRNQTPKSVKFDKKTGAEMMFEDLPKSKKTPAKQPSKGSEPEPIPEIVCAICRKGRSKPPNEIVLCENCDYAVHQQCYGVSEIPEGDWLCKSCSQDDAVVNVQKLEPAPPIPAAPVTAAEVPDIPNFELHLRSLQRVLLDRCAGRRRIDMFGLQEVQDKTRQIVEQTVVAGEGNSMLLIGARGSGKTTASNLFYPDT